MESKTDHEHMMSEQDTKRAFFLLLQERNLPAPESSYDLNVKWVKGQAKVTYSITAPECATQAVQMPSHHQGTTSSEPALQGLTGKATRS